MVPFKKLTVQENERLLKFPAYITMLTVINDDKLDEAKKKAAIKMVHTKTFTSDPLLFEYFREADKVFEKNIENLNKKLPKEKDKRNAALKKEILNLEKIVSKLGKEYVSTMHQSMNSFKEHVSTANHNEFVNFIFPVTISGITE